jgi:hypothetical protein
MARLLQSAALRLGGPDYGGQCRRAMEKLHRRDIARRVTVKKAVSRSVSPELRCVRAAPKD